MTKTFQTTFSSGANLGLSIRVHQVDPFALGGRTHDLPPGTPVGYLSARGKSILPIEDGKAIWFSFAVSFDRHLKNREQARWAIKLYGAKSKRNLITGEIEDDTSFLRAEGKQENGALKSFLSNLRSKKPQEPVVVPQNYIVVSAEDEGESYLDGFRLDGGEVRQFIVRALGARVTAEQQLLDETDGDIIFTAFPVKEKFVVDVGEEMVDDTDSVAYLYEELNEAEPTEEAFFKKKFTEVGDSGNPFGNADAFERGGLAAGAKISQRLQRDLVPNPEQYYDKEKAQTHTLSFRALVMGNDQNDDVDSDPELPHYGYDQDTSSSAPGTVPAPNPLYCIDQEFPINAVELTAYPDPVQLSEAAQFQNPTVFNDIPDVALSAIVGDLPRAAPPPYEPPSDPPPVQVPFSPGPLTLEIVKRCYREQQYLNRMREGQQRENFKESLRKTGSADADKGNDAGAQTKLPFRLFSTHTVIPGTRGWKVRHFKGEVGGLIRLLDQQAKNKPGESVAAKTLAALREKGYHQAISDFLAPSGGKTAAPVKVLPVGKK